MQQIECDHILGYAEPCMHEGYLVFASNDDDDFSYIETYFKYCPLCGKKLRYDDGEYINE